MIKFLTYISTFLIIILAELGDKTQVATLIYSSNHPSRRWQIFTAAAAALTVCVALEVSLGVIIARYISPTLINRITGAIFLLIGILTLFHHFKTFPRIKQSEEKILLQEKNSLQESPE